MIFFLYMERFDSLYEQGKMDNLLPTINQRRITEDIPFTEWDNVYIGFHSEGQEKEPEEMAVAIEDRYISIQRVEDGYDYTIYDADYKELDGGVYDDPDISIQTALDEIVADLKEAARNAENESRQHTLLQGNICTDSQMVSVDYEEYEARASIVDMAIVGSRCRGLEQENSDLDVVVEFAGSEREDDLFNLLHEDGLMIGGTKVDINPITEAKTGTLATYLPTVEQYLTEKRMQQQDGQEQSPGQAVEDNAVTKDTQSKIEKEDSKKIKRGQQKDNSHLDCSRMHRVS